MIVLNSLLPPYMSILNDWQLLHPCCLSRPLRSVFAIDFPLVNSTTSSMQSASLQFVPTGIAGNGTLLLKKVIFSKGISRQGGNLRAVSYKKENPRGCRVNHLFEPFPKVGA